jgi:NTE family protein
VSSVSGGAIVAGLLGVRWADLRFTDGVAANLDEQVIEPLRALCERPIGHGLARHYAHHLVGDATLRALPGRPAFVFNAVDRDARVAFRFSKASAGDHCTGVIREPSFPMASVIAASSAGLPPFPPVSIEVEPDGFERDGRPPLGAPIRLRLASGGLHDELAVEPFWKRIETVLISDAGAAEGAGLRARLGPLLEGPVRHGSCWSMTADIAGYQLRDGLPVPLPVSRALAGIQCRLSPLAEAEQCAVMNWGYAVADAAMLALGVPGPRPAPRWPYPAYALDGRVAAPAAAVASPPG